MAGSRIGSSRILRRFQPLDRLRLHQLAPSGREALELSRYDRSQLVMDVDQLLSQSKAKKVEPGLRA